MADNEHAGWGVVILAFGIAVAWVVLPILGLMAISNVDKALRAIPLFAFNYRFLGGLIAGITISVTIQLLFIYLKKHKAERLINRFLRN